MEIKTRYNIGDEVWCFGNFRKGVINGEIQDLRATAVFLDPTPTIEYTIRQVVKGKLKLYHRLEQDIFPTKEELLKSLKNKIL